MLVCVALFFIVWMLFSNIETILLKQQCQFLNKLYRQILSIHPTWKGSTHAFKMITCHFGSWDLNFTLKLIWNVIDILYTLKKWEWSENDTEKSRNITYIFKMTTFHFGSQGLNFIMKLVKQCLEHYRWVAHIKWLYMLCFV